MVWFVNYKLHIELKRGVAMCIIMMSFAILFSSNFKAIAQTDISRSQRQELKKTEKKSHSTFNDLEKNYINRQQEHYKRQDRKTRRMMRKGQKQARRQASRRTQPWLKRLIYRWKNRK